MITLFLSIVFGYLFISTVYTLVFSVAGSFPSKSQRTLSQQEYKSIAVLIPAYKEDAIIVDTAKRALSQQYPENRFFVVVIADSLQRRTIGHLKTLPVRTLEVSFEKSTKAKALNAAMAVLPAFDLAVVLDADNVMEPDFLAKVNRGYQSGFMAMQGHRVAKNEDSPMAILDAVSEEINNRIFRRGHRNLSLSSALIGSGMAFDYQLFKEKMSTIDALGGFDKALELALLREKITIHYVENARVYDEKVSNKEVFTNQRTRWIAAQIRYGMSSFGDASIQLFKNGNLDYFDKSLQFLLPPRLLALGALVFFTLFSLFVSLQFAAFFGILTGIYIFSLCLGVPKSFWTHQTFRAAFTLPMTFWLMLKATLGFKRAAKNFLHTPHQSVS